MKVRYQYASLYNFRPDEMYGMGKESLTVGPGPAIPIEDFFKMIEHNSSLKHKDNKEYIYGSDMVIEREDWKPWIGQPMFYIVDLKIEVIDDLQAI